MSFDGVFTLFKGCTAAESKWWKDPLGNKHSRRRRRTAMTLKQCKEKKAAAFKANAHPAQIRCPPDNRTEAGLLKPSQYIFVCIPPSRG